MSKEAQQALDKMAENARELGLDYEPAQLPFGVGGGLVAIKTLLSRDPCAHANTAIQMIDAILAEQPAQQEPVAWMFQHDETGRMNYVSNDGIHNPTMFLEMNPRYALVCPLYTSPPAQQEPVAWMDGYRNIYSLEEKAAGCPEATIALVPMANHKKTSGSPIKELNCICGAVWEGDELVHLPRPPAQRKPLTPEWIWTWLMDWCKRNGSSPANYNSLFKMVADARAIETTHGIKENT